MQGILKINFKILILTLLIFQFGCAQKNTLNFKISTNYLDGISYLEKNKTIKHSDSKIDIYFYKKHFAQFYGLPKRLINKKLKGRKITKWAFEDRPKKRNKNWTEFYKYDSEGKLIEYKYSGCEICSQFSWGFKLIYNKNNKVIEQLIYNLTPKPIIENGVIKTKFDFKEMMRQIKLTYDKEENLVKLEEFGVNGIKELIELL